uniref:Uncharacterized protein n=1 Tax=Bathycoccus sp. RCC716 virus 2 TaxID=2530039 RepID=A0A7S6P2B8_9PHYC|nr:hypothetical protein [Bathycoccus sp. RCC716 virus 2]
MQIILTILPIMFFSLLIILLSPAKIPHRFACSMEAIVYALVILYALILLLAKEGDIYVEGYTLR